MHECMYVCVLSAFVLWCEDMSARVVQLNSAQTCQSRLMKFTIMSHFLYSGGEFNMYISECSSLCCDSRLSRFYAKQISTLPAVRPERANLGLGNPYSNTPPCVRACVFVYIKSF